MLFATRSRCLASLLKRQAKLSWSHVRTAAVFCQSEAEALEGLKSGHSVLVGGFGTCGSPEHLVRYIAAQGRDKIRDLIVISCTGGADNAGIGLLVPNKQVKRVVASFVGHGKTLQEQMMSGDVEFELVPQGTLAERIRCGGAGVPAFYSPAGVGTPVEFGGMVIAYNRDGSVRLRSEPKEKRIFNGVPYLLEQAIKADFALVKAWKADKLGNLVFRKSSFNYNPVIARSAKCVVAEVEEIVERGEIPGENIHVSGVYVDRVFKGTNFKKPIQFPRLRSKGKSDKVDPLRERIIRRAALEFKDGDFANLGIGMPVMASNYIPEGIHVFLQSENGMMGLGPYPEDESQVDADLTNAGIEPVTEIPGAAFFGSDESFAMIRGGHLNLTMLGALQVSQYGDLANWTIPGKRQFGMGGAMELVSSRVAGTRVVVTMEHNSREGEPKIVSACNMPLTGVRCIDRIITDKAVFDVDPDKGLTLIEVAEGLTVDDIRKFTEAPFKVAPDVKTMGQVPV